MGLQVEMLRFMAIHHFRTHPNLHHIAGDVSQNPMKYLMKYLK